MNGFKTILIRRPYELVGIAMSGRKIVVMLENGRDRTEYDETHATEHATQKRYNEIIMLCIVNYGFEVFSEEVIN